MAKSTPEYIPALGFQWLTGFYDPVIRWTIRESTFKGRLLEQARIEPGYWVLDLGCGTGTLALLIKSHHPSAQVIGLDADRKVLEIARAKAARAGLDIILGHGMAFELPYANNSVDRVVLNKLIYKVNPEKKILKI
jgi:ubiquinone/menaquinone biosynthesis C-methylase UbiE